MENLIDISHLCKQYGAFSLKDVSLTLPAGSIVGLIGENGAGKTTTLKSLLGLIRPDGGQISLMGMDAQKEGIRAHEQIGVVLDECCFHDHLTPTHLARILSPLFPSWDHGYYASLLERFTLNPGKPVKDLSRGMKTKLSLACALAHHPRLLILDEATSALDNATEMLIQQALEKLSEGRTSLIVAHRLSTIKNADEIIVLTDDGIAERGTHEDLLAKGGIYAGLYQYQFRE